MSLREVLEGMPVINSISPTQHFAHLNAKFTQRKSFSDRFVLEIRLRNVGKNGTRVAIFCRTDAFGEVKFTRLSLFKNEVDAWLLESSTIDLKNSRLDFSTQCRKKNFGQQHRLVILSSRIARAQQRRRVTPHVQDARLRRQPTAHPRSNLFLSKFFSEDQPTPSELRSPGSQSLVGLRRRASRMSFGWCRSFQGRSAVLA